MIFAPILWLLALLWFGCWAFITGLVAETHWAYWPFVLTFMLVVAVGVGWFFSILDNE